MSLHTKTEEELVSALRVAEELVTIGALYSHYKNQAQQYRVLGCAISESDNAVQVIYQAQQGSRLTFTRPLSEWLQNVTWEGQEVPRFRKAQA